MERLAEEIAIEKEYSQRLEAESQVAEDTVAHLLSLLSAHLSKDNMRVVQNYIDCDGRQASQLGSRTTRAQVPEPHPRNNNRSPSPELRGKKDPDFLEVFIGCFSQEIFDMEMLQKARETEIEDVSVHLTFKQ